MTPEQRALDIWHDLARGAFLDARMSGREEAAWKTAACAAIAAAIREATEKHEARVAALEAERDRLKDALNTTVIEATETIDRLREENAKLAAPLTEALWRLPSREQDEIVAKHPIAEPHRPPF